MSGEQKRKRTIVAEIRQMGEQWFARHMPHAERSQACLWWALLSAAVLEQKGLRARLAAGSLSWPRIDLKNDDGKIMTHFSYMWEPNSLTTIQAIMESRMPEMHVWIELPTRKELLDVTTCYLKQQCERSVGLAWLGPQPPDFLWCRIDRLPKAVIYTASQSALDYLRWAHDDVEKIFRL